MEKIDIIKTIITNNEQANQMKTNPQITKHFICLSSYYNEYIEPQLIKLSDEKILKFNYKDKQNDYFSHLYFLMSLNLLRDLIDEDDDINPLSKEQTLSGGMINYFDLTHLKNKKGNDDLLVIYTKDLDLKKEIANNFYKVFKFVGLKRNYIEDYIIPILNELNKNKTIIYNPNSKDIEIINKSSYIELYISTCLDGLYKSKNLLDENGIFIDIFNESDNKKRTIAFQLCYELFLPYFKSDEYTQWLNEMKKYNLENENTSKLDFSDYNKIIQELYDIK